MTIIRNGRNPKTAKEFVIVGVGGAGSNSATEMAKVLGNPDDVIAVDREAVEMRTVSTGRRISIGYPIFARDADDGDGDEFVDTNDLFRLKTVIGKPPIIFVLAGLGGDTTLELMPSVIRTATSTGASVLVVVTMPFSFEGRTRAQTASDALERIKATGCSLALIDGDNVLTNTSLAGDLAEELSAAQARVVMNVLSASSAASAGSLNTAPELLDALNGVGPTFISYASTENINAFRKAAREAINAPITSGLKLEDADHVSIILAGPRDTSIKALNATVSLIQAEVSDNAILSTSFVANPDSGNSSRLRVSILGGKRRECVVGQKEVNNTDQTIKNSIQSTESVTAGSVENEVNDLFGAPDWLVDTQDRHERTPVLL